MGTVEEIPNLRGWVEKLLTVAPMEERSWKYLSNRFGWKVKTHGNFLFHFLPYFHVYFGTY